MSRITSVDLSVSGSAVTATVHYNAAPPSTQRVDVRPSPGFSVTPDSFDAPSFGGPASATLSVSGSGLCGLRFELDASSLEQSVEISG